MSKDSDEVREITRVGNGYVVRVYDHQSVVTLSNQELGFLAGVAERAMGVVLGDWAKEEAPLRELAEVEFSFVDDEVIAQVHADFLDDPTPTDVITFHHGEVMVSAETAKRQSEEFGQNNVLREVALYIVHGLLHLGGYEDYEEAEAQEMATLQEKVLRGVWSVEG